MKTSSHRWLLTLTLAIAGAVLDPQLAAAAKARPDQIKISYVAPKNPEHQALYQRLKEGRFLEKVKEFLSPFRLPRPLLFKIEGCDGESNAWYEEEVVTICYEYIDEIWRYAPAETTPAGVTPVDALVAPVFDTALHEFGHAIFEILKIPVLGREEDAADQVASFMTLQLGKNQARRQVGGVAYAYMAEVKTATAPPKLESFANEHGTPAQRFYNVLCIAYGADPKVFGDLVAKGYLPKDRSEGCEVEYQQVAYAFTKLLGPHIDRRLAKKVLDKTWLPDPSRPVPRRPAPKPAKSN